MTTLQSCKESQSAQKQPNLQFAMWGESVVCHILRRVNKASASDSQDSVTEWLR